MTNRLMKGAHLSDRKCREIIHLFREDLNATQIAHVTHVSRITVNNYLKRIRMAIAAQAESLQPGTSNGQEQTMIAPQPVTAYGFYKSSRGISIQAVRDFDPTDLETVRHRYPHLQAVADFSCWRLYRLDNLQQVNGSSMMDEISGFWGWIKGRLQKFRGMHRNTLYLHIRECEFRYNHRDNGLEESLQQLLFPPSNSQRPFTT